METFRGYLAVHNHKCGTSRVIQKVLVEKIKSCLCNPAFD